MDLKIAEIKEAYQKLESEKDQLSAKELKKKYLHKGGVVHQLLTSIKDIEPEKRSDFGKEANMLKEYAKKLVDEKAENRKETIFAGEEIDVTAPYDKNLSQDKRPKLLSKPGSQHPLTQELEHVLEVFEAMGFHIEESRQLDNDYNMFETLNIPKGHPARDIWDTFWTDDNLIPPAHTSTMQNRVLRKYDTPIRAVMPGRCFRNEATDASHEHTLHQIEGVYVDEGISVGDLMGTIKTYLEAFFEKKLEVKLQPAFFPFTEPDMEFLISCPFCGGSGCGVCGQSGWMEIMGCGMIHPKVLEEADIDSKKYTGFAWGFGLDRLVMIKHGIEDIRWLHSGDLSFIKQF
jgi:phenylalanyl-tRNA synthetase alpha chain